MCMEMFRLDCCCFPQFFFLFFLFSLFLSLPSLVPCSWRLVVLKFNNQNFPISNKRKRPFKPHINMLSWWELKEIAKEMGKDLRDVKAAGDVEAPIAHTAPKMIVILPNFHYQALVMMFEIRAMVLFTWNISPLFSLE